MKKQTNQSVNGHLRKGAFLLLLIPLLAVCAIPFARGQRSTSKTNLAAHSPHMTNVYGTAPAVAQRPKLTIRGPVGVVCPATITESTSQAIVDGNSVSCNNGAETVENHYWRAFDMNIFTGGQEYDVTSVSFGIELAASGSGTGQPLTVNLYANHGAPFPGGDWQSNLIGTTGSINIPDQADTIFETNLSAVVPAGTLE